MTQLPTKFQQKCATSPKERRTGARKAFEGFMGAAQKAANRRRDQRISPFRRASRTSA